MLKLVIKGFIIKRMSNSDFEISYFNYSYSIPVEKCVTSLKFEEKGFDKNINHTSSFLQCSRNKLKIHY